MRFRPSQQSTVGLVTHANSITLTPGTITVEAERGEFLVHALTREAAAGVARQRDGPARRAASREARDVRRAALALLVTLALLLVRAVAGPTVFDRVLAANTIGTVAMLLLAVIGFLTGRPEFLDLAIVYGLLNVVGTIAVLKFFRHGDLGDPATMRRCASSTSLMRRAGLPRRGRRCSASSARVGLLRMPDFYTRMHAASVTDTLGAGLILLGLMLQAGLTLVTVKLLMVGLLHLLHQPDRDACARARPRSAAASKPLLAAGGARHRSADHQRPAGADGGRRWSPSRAAATCSRWSCSAASTAS